MKRYNLVKLYSNYDLYNLDSIEYTIEEAKTCPNCGVKNKKPFHKRPMVIVCAFLVIISIIGQNDNEVNNLDNNQNTISSDVNSNNESNYNYNNIDIVKENNTTKEDDVPAEYKSALKKAQIYSDMMHMSKKGLYNQLTSEYGEQYSEESAQYAIDNVDADWKYYALK